MKNKTEKAYEEILKVLKKHKDIIVFDIDNLESRSKHHLLGVELRDKFGLNIDPKEINSLGWNKLRDGISIGLWGEVHNRTISWSDDGSQPENELLLCFNYPTGAYIFGGDYPTEFFHKFFLELKSYNPKYTDSHNSSLFFSMENAGKIYNAYDGIITRYYEKNRKDAKNRKILKMKEDLAKLEKS